MGGAEPEPWEVQDQVTQEGTWEPGVEEAWWPLGPGEPGGLAPHRPTEHSKLGLLPLASGHGSELRRARCRWERSWNQSLSFLVLHRVCVHCPRAQGLKSLANYSLTASVGRESRARAPQEVAVKLSAWAVVSSDSWTRGRFASKLLRWPWRAWSLVTGAYAQGCPPQGSRLPPRVGKRTQSLL